VDNSPNLVTYSEITYFTGKPYTVQYLVDLMQIGEYQIHYQNAPDSPVDVVVKLGDVWANNNPMP